LGEDVRIIGYDFDRGDAYVDFYEAAGLEFQQAEHPYLLPFDDESIDVVVGSGVLEHVVSPAASLTELHRVLSTGGSLVITFLPNRWSWTEWLLRTSGSNFYHRRRYPRSSIGRLLLDHGFEPQVSGYHQFVPGQRGGQLGDAMWRWNSFLEQAVPAKYFSANLFAIAIKRRAI
jgi:SAM-dependent methyltransferase